MSVGMALLVSNGSAMALPRIPSSLFQIAQADDSQPSVVVDTEGSGTSTSSTTAYGDTRFSCQFVNGQYTVMYQPESQPDQAFPWATPAAMGGGWSPQKRCQEISRRLESYRPDGLLELTTGRENGYNTVCVTTEAVPSCRIVFTVPSGKDPLVTRDRVFENLTVADSGQQTDAVYTYRERNQGLGDLFNRGRDLLSGKNKKQGINLKPFLDKNDGGTGTNLKRGVPAQSSNGSNGSNGRLNPGSFR